LVAEWHDQNINIFEAVVYESIKKQVDHEA